MTVWVPISDTTVTSATSKRSSTDITNEPTKVPMFLGDPGRHSLKGFHWRELFKRTVYKGGGRGSGAKEGCDVPRSSNSEKLGHPWSRKKNKMKTGRTLRDQWHPITTWLIENPPPLESLTLHILKSYRIKPCFKLLQTTNKNNCPINYRNRKQE